MNSAICLLTGAVRVRLRAEPLKMLGELEDPELTQDIIDEAVKMAVEDKLGGFQVAALERSEQQHALYRADVDFESLLHKVRELQRFNDRAEEAAERAAQGLDRCEQHCGAIAAAAGAGGDAEQSAEQLAAGHRAQLAAVSAALKELRAQQAAVGELLGRLIVSEEDAEAAAASAPPSLEPPPLSAFVPPQRCPRCGGGGPCSDDASDRSPGAMGYQQIGGGGDGESDGDPLAAAPEALGSDEESSAAEQDPLPASPGSPPA
eukprot:TRINITY_DN18998_c0_g1_i1.p1 TRINITY_DN18998_c0_g1~~TRINITY_DN18998_c0_g1_i1.p1  ORF type:complete len:262 (+),score=71.87 TRINITY_DN18998_c0_g1_i1:93-878(+)